MTDDEILRYIDRRIEDHLRLFDQWKLEHERADILATKMTEEMYQDVRSLRTWRSELAGKASIWQVVLSMLLSGISIAIALLR